MNEPYTIRCTCHTYITLEWNDKFIACYLDTNSPVPRHATQSMKSVSRSPPPAA